jgi:protein dithiol oxidoreductase (disulfide-forming)
MNRLTIWTLGAALACVAATAAAAAELQAGRDYVLVQPAQPTNDKTRIVVTEFFSYQCPHCYSFSPSLAGWVAKLPADVSFERVPVAFGRDAWKGAAQLFYALQALDKVAALDSAVFKAIHVDRKPFAAEAEITDWAAAQGLDRAAFAATFNSFSVRTFLNRSDQLVRSHKVASVPTLVIDGKYMVSIGDTGNFAPQLAIVDALIEKARAERRQQ